MGRERSVGTPLPETPEGLLPEYAARINHGRWIVECIHCKSALDVTPADTTAICLECGTEWFAVTFPSPGLKLAIEQVLLKRPGELGRGFMNSHWTPGESLAQLRAENREHGRKV